jgi:DNA-binding response OmpR family regulator
MSLAIFIGITDCYDGLMKFSNPVLICDEILEFRILLRDMLTKNGYFHILEASNTNEALEILKDKKDYFVMIEAKQLTSEISPALLSQKSFIVFVSDTDTKALTLSVKYGVNHIMTYPFHSRKLLSKINSLL